MLAIYLAIKHFRHILEGRNFTVFTDHKPLVFALHTKSDKYNPRDYRQLDFISQFTTDIQHIAGNDNVVADTLSRASLHSTIEEKLDMEILADEQVRDVTLFNSLQDSSLKIEQNPLPFSAKFIACDTSTSNPRPLVPASMRRKIFNHFHSFSHPGRKATSKMISERFVWPNMNSDTGLSVVLLANILKSIVILSH